MLLQDYHINMRMVRKGEKALFKRRILYTIRCFF